MQHRANCLGQNNMVTKVLDRLKSQYHSWEGVEVVLIVSTGRTATKFFSGFFDHNFAPVLGRHEPAPDLFELGTDYVRNVCSHRNAVSLLKRYRYPVYKKLKETGATVYLESNNNAALLLPVVKEVFPELKVVFITRDPKSYLISAYSKSHGQPGYKLYGKNDPRDRLTAKDFPGDRLFDAWDEIPRFEKLCWHWKTYNALISKFLSGDVDYISLKYEDLFGQDFLTIKKLIEFVGVSLPDQSTDQFLSTLLARKSNQSDTYQMLPFAQWDAAKRQSFHDILGEDAKKYRYS